MRIEDHVDRMLDEALEMTFPASDPFTVYRPVVETHRESGALALETTTSFPTAA